MNWTEYCKLAARTESLPTIEGIPTRVSRLLHASLGLQTETSEFYMATSMQNVVEELGDVYWYLAILCNEFGLDRPVVISKDTSTQTITELQDICKRCIFYGVPLDSTPNKNYPQGMLAAVTDAYCSLFIWADRQCRTIGVARAEVLEANITKLAKRYPDLAFNSERSIHRDTEAELSHIAQEEGKPDED